MQELFSKRFTCLFLLLYSSSLKPLPPGTACYIVLLCPCNMLLLSNHRGRLTRLIIDPQLKSSRPCIPSPYTNTHTSTAPQ
ncbi:hypothetical protein DFH27DRAFT_236775 [Peziza echinospora]|nr:hypothetical protein DFH27DRAFT_236775 [Peziza echinospora]